VAGGRDHLTYFPKILGKTPKFADLTFSVKSSLPLPPAKRESRVRAARRSEAKPR
jgi:hypothetical protein